MKESEIKPTENHKRLRTLYAVSKLLSNIVNVETSFSEILTSAAESFPLLTAVLIEHWEGRPRTTLWQSADATDGQVEAAILNARNNYSYLSGASNSDSTKFFREDAPVHILQRNSKTLSSHVNNEGNYIFLPLVVFNLPPHGALQFEGALPLDEDDLEFVGALADLMCISLDRHYKTKTEIDLIKNEVLEGFEKLSFSKEETSNLLQERQLREAFVSLLSHDLRTPLTSALMSAQLIERKSNDPEMCILLAKKVGISINRIESMINNLLDANLIRSGGNFPINVEFFNLHHLVKSVLDELIIIHGNRFILKGSGKIKGLWDKKAIYRILENLCSNGIKYGLQETPVTIFLEQDPGKKVVYIRVHNEGDVISIKDQNFLFDQFRRSETAHSSKSKGWGLGLALVRGMAEAHGGSVSVNSSIATGTNFIVTLPINLNFIK